MTRECMLTMPLTVKPVHDLTCHCGAVRLRLTLPNGIEDPHRCDCSICRRRGAILASVDVENLVVLQGAEHLGLYQFNTRIAKHYFCKICGIYTHNQRRWNPAQYCYNVGCLDGVNHFDLGDVPHYVDADQSANSP